MVDTKGRGCRQGRMDGGHRWKRMQARQNGGHRWKRVQARQYGGDLFERFGIKGEYSFFIDFLRVVAGCRPSCSQYLGIRLAEQSISVPFSSVGIKLIWLFFVCHCTCTNCFQPPKFVFQEPGWRMQNGGYRWRRMQARQNGGYRWKRMQARQNGGHRWKRMQARLKAISTCAMTNKKKPN